MVSQKQKVELREQAPSPVSERQMATRPEKQSYCQRAVVPPGEARIWLPSSWRRPALVGVKAVHSLFYFSIEYCMGYLIYAGLRGRQDRRTAIAAGVVGGECLIFLGNRCRCPLTRLAENLGAASGSVTDIYLAGLSCFPSLSDPRAALRFGAVLARRNFRRRSRA